MKSSEPHTNAFWKRHNRERMVNMKRILCVLLAVMLLFVLSGCDVQTWFSERFYNFHNYDGVLPQTIRVHSQEALERLISAAQLSDEEFADFIKQARKPGGQLSIPYNTKKQQIKVFAYLMEEFGIPLFRDDVAPERFLLEYRPKSAWMSVTYQLNDITYRFVSRPCSFEESFMEYRKGTHALFTEEIDEIMRFGITSENFDYLIVESVSLNWVEGSLVGAVLQDDSCGGDRLIYVIVTPGVDLQTEFRWD